MRRAPPPGYRRLDVAHAEVVAHDKLAGDVRAAVGSGTLYDWAAGHPDRRQLQGRIPAWSAPLPGGGTRVVVRRSHRGGLLAPLLRDLFPPPTRAPLELSISFLLRQSGVPTPPVAAYAVYRAGPLLRRADVLTLELEGEDLGAALGRNPLPEERRHLLPLIASLIGALTQAGAWHQDLNVKNVFLASDGGTLHPAVLDVDRVTFVIPGDPNLRDANFERLARSMRKWRRTRGLGLTEPELAEVRDLLTRDEAQHAAQRALALEEFMP